MKNEIHIHVWDKLHINYISHFTKEWSILLPSFILFVKYKNYTIKRVECEVSFLVRHIKGMRLNSTKHNVEARAFLDIVPFLELRIFVVLIEAIFLYYVDFNVFAGKQTHVDILYRMFPKSLTSFHFAKERKSKRSGKCTDQRLSVWVHIS